MKILLLTQTFYPELAPDIKGLPFARQLRKKGHSVQVLTAFPNYPGGKMYKGYKIKFFQREVIDGIEVIRVPLYPSHDHNPIRRTLCYLSFALSAALIGIFLIRKPDVMHVYQPPATIAIPAIFIKLLRKVPIVYDIQDLWPDTLKATGMVNSNFIIRLVGIYCKIAYKLFDKIVVLSPGLKKKLIERGVNPGKVQVIYNWSNYIPLSGKNGNKSRQRLFPNEKFTVLFAGNMGKAQGLDSVVMAAKIILEKNSNIQLAFIGGGIEVENLKRMKNDFGLDNVVFLEKVSGVRIGKLLESSDALLVHLKKDPLFEITIPSKIQAYLMVGRPIINGVRGDAAELVLQSNAAVSCEPGDPVDIADKILELSQMPEEKLNQMGNNGKTFYQNHLSIEMGMEKFLKIFNDLINNKNGRYDNKEPQSELVDAKQ